MELEKIRQTHALRLLMLLIFVLGFTLGALSLSITPNLGTGVTTITKTKTLTIERTVTRLETITVYNESIATVTVTKTIVEESEKPPIIVKLYYSSGGTSAEAGYMSTISDDVVHVSAEMKLDAGSGLAYINIKADMLITSKNITTKLRFKYHLPMPFTPPEAYNVTIYLLEDDKLLAIARGLVKIDLKKGFGEGVLPLEWYTSTPVLSRIKIVHIHLKPIS